MRDSSSEELAARARAGSDDSFSVLVERYSSELLGFLSRKVPNQEDARDLVQETFIRAHDRIHLYDPQHKFKSWLFTIGARLSYSLHRKRRDVCIPLHEPVDTRSPAAIACSREESENLWDQVSRMLPASQADCLWLRYAEGLSVSEIAARTGKTRVNVKVQLHRARVRLHDQLKLRYSSPALEARK